MVAVTFDPHRPGCYLGENAGANIVNEEIILASGAGIVKPGTVLGKITASGKYLPHDAAASDGSQNAAAIFFGKGDGNANADATSADAKAVATVNGPATINGTMLIFKAGISGANRTAAIAALRAKGMKVLPQHAA